MNKIVNPVDIDSTSTPKWTEPVVTITPEVIEVPDYDYWASQDTLDANIAIRNLDIPKFKQLVTSRWASTWDFAITWVWFKPKMVRIQGHDNWGSHTEWSDWTAVDWDLWNVIYKSWATWAIWEDTWNILVLYLDPSNNQVAKLKSMDADWCTLTFTTSVWSSIRMFYTFYW